MTTTMFASKPLIANTLRRPEAGRRRTANARPVTVELRRPAAELAAARAALADPRPTQERVVDRIVDRLLTELTW